MKIFLYNNNKIIVITNDYCYHICNRKNVYREICTLFVESRRVLFKDAQNTKGAHSVLCAVNYHDVPSLKN